MTGFLSSHWFALLPTRELGQADQVCCILQHAQQQMTFDYTNTGADGLPHSARTL